MTSTVKAAEGSEMNDETKEQIIRAAVARMKEELRADEEARRDSELFNRRSDAG